MHRHSPFRPKGAVLPDQLVDAAGAEYLAWVGHEQPQDAIFDGGQGYRVPVQGHGFGLVVQANATDLQHRGLLLHASQLGVPPELAAYPGHHLHRIEGLGNIIVRPQVQPQHLVRILAFRRNKDHRHIAGPAQLDGGGYAVQSRHHDIHQHQVDLFPFHAGQGFLAIVCLLHLIAFRL